ncbi:inositol monophosphatase family protein [Herbaspirillum sp. RV1423]|uniref:inositol monophosphatase family protein n=1 Tax=Herbaspirillum sp. RV1423 TaxID=1443993 RepID=UPI0004B62870|nr:inositol monophosphatase family protein [Herbaspirillum sp. RV1423]
MTAFLPPAPFFTKAAEPAQLQEFHAFIGELCKISGAIIRGHYLSGTAVESKSDQSPVTAADRDTEQALRAAIMARYPQHGIIGEEFGAHQQDAEYCWVLDPIDGTKAFVTNCYIFGTLISVMHQGRPIVGALHSPLMEHLLIGTVHGATLNGKPVGMRACTDIGDAMLLATDHWDIFKHHDGPAFERLSRRTRLYRGWGDCHGYFQLATGGADIMLDPVLKIWDIMSIVPIIEGAGGRITDWQGNSPLDATSVVATAGGLHDEVLRALNP